MIGVGGVVGAHPFEVELEYIFIVAWCEKDVAVGPYLGYHGVVERV